MRLLHYERRANGARQLFVSWWLVLAVVAAMVSPVLLTAVMP